MGRVKVADRKQDAADLINVYQATGDEFDRDAAIAYGRTVYPGAERELAELLDGIDSGRDVPV